MPLSQASHRHVGIIAPQLENYIQDNFPDVDENRIPEVATALVEMVLQEMSVILKNEDKLARKVESDARDAYMKKANRKPPTHKELGKQFEKRVDEIQKRVDTWSHHEHRSSRSITERA